MTRACYLLLVFVCVFSTCSAQKSCRGRCGEAYYRGSACQCDNECLAHNECCRNYESVCTTRESCKGRCGERFKRGRTCHCDIACVQYGQCCPDYESACTTEESNMDEGDETDVDPQDDMAYEDLNYPEEVVYPTPVVPSGNGAPSSNSPDVQQSPTVVEPSPSPTAVKPSPPLELADDESKLSGAMKTASELGRVEEEQGSTISDPERLSSSAAPVSPEIIPTRPTTSQCSRDPSAAARQDKAASPLTPAPLSQSTPASAQTTSGDTPATTASPSNAKMAPTTRLGSSDPEQPEDTQSPEEAPGAQEEHAEPSENIDPVPAEIQNEDPIEKPSSTDMTTNAQDENIKDLPSTKQDKPEPTGPTSGPEMKPSNPELPEEMPPSEDKTQPHSGQDSPENNQSHTEQDPPKNNQSHTGQDPPENNQPRTGQDPPENNQSHTEQDPPKNNQSHTGQDPPENNQPHTGQDPPENNQSHTGQDPPENNQSHTGQDPPENNQPHTGQDPPENNQSHTGQDPPENNKPDAGQDPPENNKPDTGQDPPENNQPHRGQGSPENNQSHTGQDPPENNKPDAGQDPPENNQPHTEQDPPKNNQSHTGQDPPENNQPDKGQDPPENNQPHTGQDPPEKSQPHTVQNAPEPSENKPSTGLEIDYVGPTDKPSFVITTTHPEELSSELYSTTLPSLKSSPASAKESPSPTKSPEKPTKPKSDVVEALYEGSPGDYQADSNNDTNLCSGRPVNGLTTLQNGTIVVFRGHYFWTLDSRKKPGPAQGITDVWGIPSPIDTVYTRCNCQGKTYFFKGNNYWRFENGIKDPGFPKPISDGFGLGGDITAALPMPRYRSRRESVLFFKRGGLAQRYTYRITPQCGSKLAVYTTSRRVRRAENPELGLEINIRSWRGFPSRVTSAMSVPTIGGDGYKYYIFSPTKYYNVKLEGDTPVILTPKGGVERQRSARSWFRCQETLKK